MGRASIFSDPSVIAFLQHDFVAVAANAAHLAPEEKERRNWCESSRFIESVIKKSRLRKQDSSESAQGYYAFSAAGDFYGAINGDKADVVKLLENAKKTFAESPPKKAELKETTMGPEAKIPDEAIVLRVYSRIVPLPEDVPQDSLNRSVGRDHLWITKEEQVAMLKALASIETADAPETLSKRIVRFHLTDNVRGESDLWDSENVKVRSFQISRIADSPTLLTVKLKGSFSMLMPKRKRDEKPHLVPEMGYAGTLEGIFQIDKSRQKLTAAKIFASGEAWGESVYTIGAPKGKFPLKIAMVLADDANSREIAPQGLMGNERTEYLNPTSP